MPRCYNDFLPAADRLARLLYREEIYGSGMEALPAILEQHPRLLVIMNHGPMLGPAPALAALVRVMAHNGGGQRLPFGVAWRGFYQVPGLRQLASRFTQASGDLGVDEVVERLTTGPFNDCGLMPEGNCAMPAMAWMFSHSAATALSRWRSGRKSPSSCWPIRGVSDSGSRSMCHRQPAPWSGVFRSTCAGRSARAV